MRRDLGEPLAGCIANIFRAAAISTAISIAAVIWKLAA
jgi:hypothetical protein